MKGLNTFHSPNFPLLNKKTKIIAVRRWKHLRLMQFLRTSPQKRNRSQEMRAGIESASSDIICGTCSRKGCCGMKLKPLDPSKYGLNRFNG